MSRFVGGVLIAFLLVACSVGSAQKVEFISYTTAIGASFSFDVPYKYDQKNERIASDKIVGENGKPYDYVAGSLQPMKNNFFSSYVEISYFHEGRPPADLERGAFLVSFKRIGGILPNPEPKKGVVCGYAGEIWEGTYISAEGIDGPAYVPTTLALLGVDETRTLAILAEPPVFEEINKSLVIELEDNLYLPLFVLQK
jgi:hypothetical protein